MEHEVERLKEMLRNTNPLSRDYDTLLGYMERIKWLANPPMVSEPGVMEAKEDSFPAPEPVGEPEQPSVAETPIVKEEEKLTKEKVRALLKEAAESGVMVQPIMAKFIPDGKKQTFSSVKVSDYPALVEELENARHA